VNTVPHVVYVTHDAGFWHVDLTTLIGAVALFFAWRAAQAAMTTVRDTREMRWEANLNRVLEALAAIEARAKEVQQGHTLLDFLWSAQLELDRALAFPRVLTDDNTALQLLEQLRSRDARPIDLEGWAKMATRLLSTQPPGEKWPRPVLFTMTFIPSRKAQLREWWARRRRSSQKA
jgi:hypothetical protein